MSAGQLDEPGQVADLYKSYGDLESMVSRLISRQVPNQIENTFGRYTAIRAVQERGQFVIDAAADLPPVLVPLPS